MSTLRGGKVSSHSFYSKNLLEMLEYSENAVCKKDGKVEHFSLRDTNAVSLGVELKSLIKVGNSIFYYAANNNLYLGKGTKFINLSKSFSSIPTIVEITRNGTVFSLVLDGDGNGYTVDANGTVETYSVPKGKKAVVYNGMLFIGNKNELYFSSATDVLDFTMDLSHGGLIKTDSNDGHVKGLVVQENKLLIFVANAIYEFMAFGDRLDYTLKKVETLVPNVLDLSPRDCGDKILFICDKKLYLYKGGKIKKIESILEYDELQIFDNPVVEQSVYCIPLITDSGNRKLLRYDCETDEECLIDCGKSVTSDGGFAVNNFGRRLKIEKKSNASTNSTFKSKSIDFDTAKTKVINDISFIATGEGVLTLSGDYGDKTFKIKSGSNVKRMNVPSRTFIFTFTGKGDFSVKNLRIKYRIKGE